MKLSIIIPIYNVEKYVYKCIMSALNSDINELDYEIIAVNDGSTDSSLEIISKLANEFPKIKVYTKKNGGLSSARNYGIERSSGDYIFFLDSDDYIESKGLNELLQLSINNKLDCISFTYKKVDDSGNILPKKEYFYEYGVLKSGADFMSENTLESMAWKYLFKRDILELNNLKFIDGIYHEDEAFTPVFISYCQRVMSVNCVIYNYLQRNNSIIGNKDIANMEKKICDMNSVIDFIQHRINKLNIKEDNNIFCALSKKKEQLVLSNCIRIKTWDLPKGFKKEVVLKMKKSNIVPLKLNYYTSLKYKLFAIWFNIYCFICLRTNN